MSVVYLNGAFMPQDKARVSVMDRGFLFGDGVYEVIPVFAGAMFRMAEHTQRLQRSLAAIDLSLAMTAADWNGLLVALLERNNAYAVGSVYVQVTRGIGRGGREHVFDEQAVPTVFAMCKAAGKRRFDQGVRAITHEDIRWRYCDIKAITLLPNVLLKQRARQAGAFEAILLKDGRLTEGAVSNVFIVQDGIIKTPPKDSALLPGVTRDLIVELAKEAQLDCQESSISEAALRGADEIWITGSTVGVAPVIMLDGQPVATGRPGAYWQEMNNIYERFKHTGKQPGKSAGSA